MKKITYLIIFLIFIGAGFLTTYSVKAEYQLEVEYPTLPFKGGARPSGELVSYIRYLYFFGLLLTGLTAFGVLVYGWLQYMLS